MMIFYEKGKKEKGTMFLSKILIHSCMIIVKEWKKTLFEEKYIVEENTFCKCLEDFGTEKIFKSPLKIA